MSLKFRVDDTKLTTNNDGSFVATVHYAVQDDSTDEHKAGVHVYVIFDRDDTITISGAHEKAIERAREILSELVAHEQSGH